jgi:hypothetical protein
VKSDTDFLTKEFRRFVTNWLKVFEECSIDPVEHPKLVVSQDDERYQALGTIPEICDYILERLKVTEVRFVSVQREKDTAILKKEPQGDSKTDQICHRGHAGADAIRHPGVFPDTLQAEARAE